MRAASSAAPESQKPVPEPKKPLTITQAEVTLSWLDVALSSQILELLKDPNNVIAYLLPAPAIVVGKYEDYVIGYLSNFDYAYVFINGVLCLTLASKTTDDGSSVTFQRIDQFLRPGRNELKVRVLPVAMTGKITFELFGDGNRILHLEHTEVQYRDHIWYVEYRP